MKLINIYDNLFVRLDKAKTTKYIKRIPKPTGKGYYYFYNQKQIKDYKEKGKVPEDGKEGGILSGIMSFFGFKDEKQATNKAKETFNANKKELSGVDIGTFTDYMNEYLSNKDKWDKKLAGKSTYTKDKKTGVIKKKVAGDKKSSAPGKSGEKWDMSLMRKVAGIVGGVGDKNAVMSDDNFINMKSSQKYINDMMEFNNNNKDKAIGYIKKLIDIIKNKDYNELVELLHSGNKSSRKMFEESTGLKLGNNKNSTKETLKKYVGEENFKKGEKEIQEKKEKYENEKQLKKEKSYKESQIKDLEKKIKYDNEVMTTKEFIDKNIKEGTEYKEVKRGINTVGQLWNGNSYIELKSKSEKNYAKENLPEKPKEKESAKGNQAKYDQAKQDIKEFEDDYEKEDRKENWQKVVKEMEQDFRDEIEDGYEGPKEALKELLNYKKSVKNLPVLKEKLMGPKMFKAVKIGDKYYKLNKAKKKVPIGTISNGRKKVAEGKWVPVGEGKDKVSKPDKKKTDKKTEKPGASAGKEGAKERLKNTLKKIANILAEALSGKDVNQPTGQAVEEVGESSKRNKKIKVKKDKLDKFKENKKKNDSGKAKDDKPKKE